MSSMTLIHTNGSKPHAAPQPWLQLPTRKFFSEFNWDDNPPEVQEIKLTAAAGSTEPLSLALSVSQFMGAVNWDGIATTSTPDTPIEPLLGEMDDSSLSAFTLEDFSDLF